MLALGGVGKFCLQKMVIFLFRPICDANFVQFAIDYHLILCAQAAKNAHASPPCSGYKQDKELYCYC